ncbi:unnamed protein product [Meganyctiphanes norvegica]|uniref:C-type lectin domain-containing protein n=1 Tax=Meganyctiphanes norvegica TaxID=48144 RepID=A0AAV2SFM4_MEGNR
MNITNADFYVGGQYKYQQKVWKWVNKSNITMDDEFWVDRSPCEYSNDNGTHCLAIFANVAKFRGKPCENSHSYICQRLNKSMLSNHLLNHHGIGNTLEPIATYYGQYNLYYIIGAILLVLGLLALTLIIYVCRKRKQSQAKIKESKYIADPSVNQPTRHDSENSLYGQACSTGSNLSARHDSENSLYGQT